MESDIDQLRRRAVPLSDDSLGVSTESKARKITPNGDSLCTSLSPRWLDLLNLGLKDETMHSLSQGHRPVIVQKPAIIVQPAELVDAEDVAIAQEVWPPWRR